MSIRKLTTGTALVVALTTVAGTASAATATLVGHYQRSSSGTLSTLVWNGANAGTSWGISVGMQASNATWDWDGTTLSSSGLFWSTSHISSSPFASAIIGDRVVDLSINTAGSTVGASTYECTEGTFLSFVGAHGCADVNLGANFTFDSSLTYNVDGDPDNVVLALDGDDAPFDGSPGPRNLSQAFSLFTVVSAPDPVAGGTLILSNGIDISLAGTSYMEFSVAAVPAPPAVWLLGSAALGLFGWARRRTRG